MAYVAPSQRDGMSLMPKRPRRREVPPLDAAKDFREFERIDAERQKHVPRWREIYDLMMPNRTAFECFGDRAQTDQPPVSSYPSFALNRGVGKLISALFPFERAWFELLARVAHDGVPEDQADAVNEALEKYRGIVLDAIGKTEYPGELTAMMRDVFCSLGGMRVERGKSRDEMVVVGAKPLAELYPIFAPGGNVRGVMRKYEMAVGDIEAEFAGPGRVVNLPPSLKEKATSDPGHKVWLLEVSRTVDRVGQRCTVYLFADKFVLMDYVGSDPDEPPAWIIVPWGKVAGQSYPPGPADRALESARMLNHIEDADAMAFDEATHPAMMFDEASGLTAETFQPVPYAKIPFSSRELNGASPIVPVQSGASPQYSQLKAEEKKAELDDILFASRTLPPVEDSHGMTATEVRMRWMEKLREEGVDFGTLNRAFGLGFISRVVWVLQSWGEIPPILKVNGRLFKIRYAGPLATAQDADDAQNLADTVQLSIATVGPELTSDALRTEDVPGMLVDKRNAPASLKRSEQEMQQRAEQRMQMQAAQMAVENGLVPGLGQGQTAA
jgi:hypothetical protein